MKALNVEIVDTKVNDLGIDRWGHYHGDGDGPVFAYQADGHDVCGDPSMVRGHVRASDQRSAFDEIQRRHPGVELEYRG